MTKRIVYYIIQATAKENQNGTFHYSEPFSDFQKAKEKVKEVVNDFVVIEKHHEYFRGEEYKPEYAWEIDHNFAIEIMEY